VGLDLHQAHFTLLSHDQYCTHTSHLTLSHHTVATGTAAKKSEGT